MKSIVDQNKIQQVLQQIVSLSDPDTLSFALKEIEGGKIIRSWRPMKGAKKYPRHRAVSCRDGLIHKEILKIVHYFPHTIRDSQKEYYTFSIGCHSGLLFKSFQKFIKNNEQQILSLPGLQYTAGQNFNYGKLCFDSAQSTQDFCDLVLTSENYQII